MRYIFSNASQVDSTSTVRRKRTKRTLRHFHNFVSPFDLKKIVFNNIVYFSLNNKCKHIVLTSIKCVTNLLLQCVNPGHVQLYITTTVGTTPSLS